MFLFASNGTQKISFADFMNSIVANKGAGKALAAEVSLNKAQGNVFDYRLLFTNEISGYCFNTLKEQLGVAKTQAEKKDAELEIHTFLMVYSVVIYKLYPKIEWLKKEIDSDTVLSNNFSKIKTWLDYNDGDGMAKHFVSIVKESGNGEFFN